MACYTDSISLFVSKVNTQEVAVVACQELNELLLEVGGKMAMYPEFWSDVTTQIKLLQEQSQPRLIADEMKKHQSNPDQQVQLLIDSQSSQGTKKGNEAANRAKFEQSYAKSAVQLQLTQIMAQLVPMYFECFTLDQVKALLLNLDQLYKFAIEFNSEINLRQALW